ncbi:cryptochrome/photolyase family protein [Hansschlegelia quercus]|uniref:Deoxyribodipyrimidine photo-lyase n=1 Tax=Hansschlegelia quercus TaxID=2528245 RepID=A0A4Q9GM59_9HYPH|nr:deoxyribodipyrimidine photo-lyase [Hansschlegelia quercus]TBN54205.1 deoxyribodipyrimidine photo-lyase [Hansschlegelia quercus]
MRSDTKPITSHLTSRRSALVWFRDDLRLGDNPTLTAALTSGLPVTALYIFDDATPGPRALGAASRWWLAQSLKSLAADCTKIGLPFAVRRGSAKTMVAEAAEEAGAEAAFWSRRYSADLSNIDAAVEEELSAKGVRVESFNASLLREPWEVKAKTGGPLKVFSPYWRAANTMGEPAAPLPRPKKADVIAGPTLGGVEIEALGLEPTTPDWAGSLREVWTPGETGAVEAVERFLEEGLKGYAENRDRPDMEATSRMSPRLRFGEVSPRQLWHAVERAKEEGMATSRDVEKFRTELGWREFSYHLLHHFPDLSTRNFQERFDAFPWSPPKPEHRRAWRKGLTGYPIVDAGMRQLWTTGWLHNRVRMIVASFLIKDLLIDWRDGEDWFWDTLVDADHANNAASWQWVAGSGADAAPYFRVFNPTLQGQKFDPNGDYVRAFVPELSKLPAKWIHMPWEAPGEVMRAAGVTLGKTYPEPIVDHYVARDRALAAFAKLKAASA